MAALNNTKNEMSEIEENVFKTKYRKFIEW